MRIPQLGSLALLTVGLLASTASLAAQDVNTTNVSPDLYVPKARSTNGQPPLAHCRQINQEVNGHMVSRRQCITPATTDGHDPDAP